MEMGRQGSMGPIRASDAPNARRLCLELRSSPEDVGTARHAVGRFGIEAGFDRLEIGALELAVGEACANVVRHAYAPPGGPMLVEAVAEPDRVVITVTDEGVGGGRRAGKEPPGLGMTIMLGLCDSLDVGDGPGGTGTQVTLTFRL